jgi:cyanophycinase-like exopeptidase
MTSSQSVEDLTVADVMAGLTRWPSYQQDPWVRAAVDLLHAHNGSGHWLADRRFLARCVRRSAGNSAMLVIDWAAAAEAADELIGTRTEAAVLQFAVALATDQFGITSMDSRNRALMVAALTTATRPR